MDDYRIEHYLTAFRKQNGYATWLTKLRDKRTRAKDIDKAVKYWKNWQTRGNDENQTR